MAPDPKYDHDDRWLIIGRLDEHRILVIAFKEPAPDTYRIISMRSAERLEISRYKQEKSKRLPSENDPLARLIAQLIRNRKLQEGID